MKITLPRGYLSYSAWDLWKKDKASFRAKYYEDQKGFETPETIFGKRIARMLESKDNCVKTVDKYEVMEEKIEVEVEGIKLLGYIDSFSKRTKGFYEYKTCHNNSWSDLAVAKHQQLDWYSLLIQLKYGKVKDKCHLIVLETEKADLYYKGHKLEPINKGLRLTGKQYKYERVIEQWERDLIKEDIIKTAKEISKDYEEYKRARDNKVPF